MSYNVPYVSFATHEDFKRILKSLIVSAPCRTGGLQRIETTKTSANCFRSPASNVNRGRLLPLVLLCEGNANIPLPSERTP